MPLATGRGRTVSCLLAPGMNNACLRFYGAEGSVHSALLPLLVDLHRVLAVCAVALSATDED